MATDEYGLLNDVVDDEPMDYSPIGAEWKARAVAAEQRVRELEQRLREVRAQESTAKSKLVTAVEALRFYSKPGGLIAHHERHDRADYNDRERGAGWWAEKLSMRARWALSEIEQGDIK